MNQVTNFFILFAGVFALTITCLTPILSYDRVTYEISYYDEFVSLENKYSLLENKYAELQEKKTAVCEYKQASFNYWGMLFALIVGFFGSFYLTNILEFKLVKKNKNSKKKKCECCNINEVKNTKICNMCQEYIDDLEINIKNDKKIKLKKNIKNKMVNKR